MGAAISPALILHAWGGGGCYCGPAKCIADVMFNKLALQSVALVWWLVWVGGKEGGGRGQNCLAKGGGRILKKHQATRDAKPFWVSVPAPFKLNADVRSRDPLAESAWS